MLHAATFDPFDCRCDSPTRPPDWRWLRALHLRDHGRRCRSRDDELTASTLRYLGAFDRCATTEQHLRLRCRHAAFVDAHNLHVAANAMTWSIQAQILAARPASEIALLTGFETASIETYEALFFDMRSRLHAPDCVHQLALRRSCSFGAGGEADTVGRVLRVLGYYGGPYVLDLAEQALGLGVWPSVGFAEVCKGRRKGNSTLDKLYRLVTLLQLPEDLPADRLLRLLKELTKPPTMAGARFKSWLAMLADWIVDGGVPVEPPGDGSPPHAEPMAAAGDGQREVSKPHADDSQAPKREGRESA